MIENGAGVCPLCGADQSRPVEIIDAHAARPQTAGSLARHWANVIVVIVVFLGAMAGILRHYFGGLRVSPGAQAAEVAASSLRSVREELSAYSLFAKDAYPATLDPLGEPARQSARAASAVGYKLLYSPQHSGGDGISRSFVLLARPEKSDYLNLYIDESGVVRVTTENRPATGQDSPY